MTQHWRGNGFAAPHCAALWTFVGVNLGCPCVRFGLSQDGLSPAIHSPEHSYNMRYPSTGNSAVWTVCFSIILNETSSGMYTSRLVGPISAKCLVPKLFGQSSPHVSKEFTTLDPSQFNQSSHSGSLVRRLGAVLGTFPSHIVSQLRQTVGDHIGSEALTHQPISPLSTSTSLVHRHRLDADQHQKDIRKWGHHRNRGTHNEAHRGPMHWECHRTSHKRERVVE